MDNYSNRKLHCKPAAVILDSLIPREMLEKIRRSPVNNARN